jgi:hypothetical protein
VPTDVPRLFSQLVDDAAVFPPGNAELGEAVDGYREHRAAWYAGLVGPLLIPSSWLPDLVSTIAGTEAGDQWTVALVGDGGPDGLRDAVERADPRVGVRQVELSVAKRGEDPQPVLGRLIELLRGWPGVVGYAEVPLTWGLLAALDRLAEVRAGGLDIRAKFRTGGLAAELFPTPIELAAVIAACRDRQLPFKLTAGLHHAIRHTDPETGFVHHGFLNVLVGSALAVAGAEVADVAAVLASTDPVPLIEAARRNLEHDRQLWIGFGSCSVAEPVADLARLGLLPRGR